MLVIRNGAAQIALHLAPPFDACAYRSFFATPAQYPFSSPHGPADYRLWRYIIIVYVQIALSSHHQSSSVVSRRRRHRRRSRLRRCRRHGDEASTLYTRHPLFSFSLSRDLRLYLASPTGPHNSTRVHLTLSRTLFLHPPVVYIYNNIKR